MSSISASSAPFVPPAVGAGATLLVAPVRGDAELGGAVHVARADLHLERFALRADHGGVQRLVDAVARLGDVVLEPSRHRLPQRMHHADRRVAVAHVLAQDANADKIVDVVEVAALDDHLLIDRPIVFGPAPRSPTGARPAPRSPRRGPWSDRCRARVRDRRRAGRSLRTAWGAGSRTTGPRAPI